MMTVKTRDGATLFWATCFVLAQAHLAISVVAPYVIFTTYYGIYRIDFNDSSTVEDLVVGGYGYGALDYHYAKNLLFWINDATNTIHEARLSDGSSASVLISSSDPVDITVDWINDKLYWVDSALCEIREFNIATNTTRFILSTGTTGTSFPRGIVIYPYKNNGWLYWTDLTSGSLEMGSINGGDRESLITGLFCVQALTIDYPTHTVYWADTCIYSFQSLSLSGDRETFSYPFSQIGTVFFVSSMGKYAENLFWVEPSGIYMVERSGDGYRRVMSGSSTRRPLSLQVVHPSQQPPDYEFRDIILNSGDTEFVCEPPCNEQLGICIPPGLCACTKGWAGNTCGEDIDECTVQTDGCEQICTNYAGGYNCSCYSGYSLGNNSKSCLDIDECAIDADGCEQDCSNVAGGYECSCKSGFSLNNDGHTCSDIDECLSHEDKCQQICTNYEGGFSCSCYSGYTLESNNRTCIDVDECAVGSDECQQICTNQDGGFLCSCEPGYSLTKDMKTCTWIEVETNHMSTTVVSSRTSSSTFGKPSSSLPAGSAILQTSILLQVYLGSSSALLQQSTPTLSLPSPTRTLDLDTSTAVLSSGKSTLITTMGPLPTTASRTTASSASIDKSVTLFPSASPATSHIETSSTTSFMEPSSQMPSTMKPMPTLGVYTSLKPETKIQFSTSTLLPVPTSLPPSIDVSAVETLTATLANTQLHTLSFHTSLLSASPSSSMTDMEPTMSLVYSTMYSATTTTALEPSGSNIVATTTIPHSTSSAAPSAPMISPRLSSNAQSASSGPQTTPSATKQDFSPGPAVTLSVSIKGANTSVPVIQKTTTTKVETTSHRESISVTTTHLNMISNPGTQTVRGATTSSSDSEAPTLSSQSWSTSITRKQNIFPSVGLAQANSGLQWHTENTLTLVIVAIGVVPALTALVLLVTVLWHRRCHKRGSWYPNHNITDVVAEEQAPPRIGTVCDGHVPMSSSRSLHEETIEKQTTLAPTE